MRRSTTAGRPRNDPGIRWNGDALWARRVLRRETAGWLAELMDVSKSTVLRWESGGNAPTEEQVRQLAEIFDCKPAAFTRPPRLR